MAILRRIPMCEVEQRDAPLWWHRAGLQPTASGYGSKIALPYKVRLPGERRWRRAYVCCYGNGGTVYVVSGRDWIVLHG